MTAQDPLKAAAQAACAVEFEIEGIGVLTDERWREMFLAWQQAERPEWTATRVDRLMKQIRAALPAYLRAEAARSQSIGREALLTKLAAEVESR